MRRQGLFTKETNHILNCLKFILYLSIHILIKFLFHYILFINIEYLLYLKF